MRDWGRTIFEETKRSRRSIRIRTEDRLFQLILSDSLLKKRMIAFLDLALSTSSENLAGMFPLFFSTLPPASSWFQRLFKIPVNKHCPESMTLQILQWALKGMQERFLAGKNIEEAISSSQSWFQKHRISSSLDIVQEHVMSSPEADRYRDQILDLMHHWSTLSLSTSRTAGGVPVRHLSLKLSALTHRFTPLARDAIHEAKSRLIEIFKEAKKYSDEGRPILINVDIEENEMRETSYDLFEEALSDPELGNWEEAGIVIQAYLKDAEGIFDEVLSMARRLKKRLQVRIVKGAYHQYEQIKGARKGWNVPVFLSIDETQKSFIRLYRTALEEHKTIRIATGTHHVGQLGEIQQFRESMKLPIHCVENQFLLGVGDALAQATAKLQIPTRLYAPFGPPQQALAYLIRRLDEVTPDSAIGKFQIAGSWESYQQSEKERSKKPEPVRLKEQPPFHPEPDPDFSKKIVREKYEKALQKATNRNPIPIYPLIGEPRIWVVDQKGSFTHNPSNPSHQLARLFEPAFQEVDRAILCAQDGFAEWSNSTPKNRKEIFFRAAGMVRERKYRIAADLVLEAGKTWEAAMADVHEGIDFLNAYAIWLEDLAGFRKPLGVGVAITPFNYPFAIAMGEVAGALAMGNAVLLKPAEQTPLCSRHVAAILRDAGVPPKAIQYIPGRGETVGERLVKSPGVDFIAFTGSKQTADRIIQNASAILPYRATSKIVVAETGGKNPLIVDETADLDIAIKSILEGAFGMTGQRCSAVSRLIVLKKIKPVLLSRLHESILSLYVGNPSDSQTQLGPLIDADAKARVCHYLKLAGVNLENDGSLFLKPQLLSDVEPKSPLAQEEIFAPILSVIDAEDFQQAIQIANATPFGLTAALISRNPENIRTFFREIEAGNLYVNRPPVGARVVEQPFGGSKASGTGPQAGSQFYPARFSYPILRTSIPPHPSVSSETAPLLKESDPQTWRNLKAHQKKWRLSSLKDRQLILENLKGRFSARIDGLLISWSFQLSLLLTLQETFSLPGEINRTIHDWPLGNGILWQEKESEEDVHAAAIAALVMGNAIGLKEYPFGLQLKKIFTQAGFPEEILLTLPDIESWLDSDLIDFAVSHGPSSTAIATSLFQNPSPHHFKRLIGVTDHPEDPLYLTRFAAARTLTERTLRHGADLPLWDLSRKDLSCL